MQIDNINNRDTPANIGESLASNESNRHSVLHVCTSCRVPGSPREPQENRAGYQLYQRLRVLFKDNQVSRYVELKPVECLSLCPRPCGIALSSPGSWSYLFGDQDRERSAEQIIECVSKYINVDGGFMTRAQRPKLLQRSILGRIPPMSD